MSPDFLPAILAKDEQEFIAKVEKVRSLGQPLHIDVMDGKFVPQETWAPPDRVRDILGDTPFEVHLMVADPEHSAIVWLATGAVRVIVHAESTTRESMICRSAEHDCSRLSLAVNPETPINSLGDLINEYPSVMVMGVTPGASGQPFQTVAIEKIRELKRLKPDLEIAVDGGMSPETVRSVVEAGASRIISGSALTGSPDPESALAAFRQALS